MVDKSIGFDEMFKVEIPKPWDYNEFRHNMSVAISKMRALHSDLMITNYLEEMFDSDCNDDEVIE